MIRKVEALKKIVLSTEVDGKAVTVEDIFKSIDGNANGEFTMDELAEFLKNAGYDATPEEIVAVIRRLDTDGSQTISLLEFSKYMKLLSPAPKEVDVTNYNPKTYAAPTYESPYYRSYLGYSPYYSRYWDSPYYSPYASRYYESPYYSSYYGRYSSYNPYWRSSVYDRYPYYPSYYSSSAYLDAKYGTYTRPVRYSAPVYDYVSPVRTVYSSPIREKVVYSSYSPVSTAYTYSSPVRSVYSSPFVDRTYVSPYSGSMIYY